MKLKIHSSLDAPSESPNLLGEPRASGDISAQVTPLRPDGSETVALPQEVPGRIVIVGNGMVGHRLALELRRQRPLAATRIVLFGDEATDAYDRVHLSDVLQGKRPESLGLSEAGWEEREQIVVVQGDAVVGVDRERRVVESARGRREPYDVLVFATGSAPILGKFPGNDGRDIRCFRDTRDAVEVARLAQACRQAQLPVAVVGAGLLGLELTDHLLRLGNQVELFDSQEYPLSRQLEAESGAALLGQLQRPGLQLHLPARIEAFREEEFGTSVLVAGADPIRVGLVVLAIGVRPRDKLAREAGLACDLFGGIEVDDQLRSSDPSIYAVGECARHRGNTFGLVAPGYAMAEVLAERLAGNVQARFEGRVVGTRLKFEGLSVSVLGESSATGVDVTARSFKAEGVFRRIVVARRQVIGLVSIGTWAELSRAEHALARHEPVGQPELTRFEKGATVWTSTRLSVASWPESATVCVCTGVTAGALLRAERAGARTFEDLCAKTGASRVCGTCEPLVRSVVEAAEPAPSSRLLPALAWLSVGLAVAYLWLPSLPFASTIRELEGDALWRDATLKQLTGYSLVVLYLLGLLMSVKKRSRRLRKGTFEGFRVFHAAIGALCVGGLFLHTGLRLGVQLDRALILVVLTSTLLGGLAGGVPSLVSASRSQAMRLLLNRLHLAVLWPLPVLLVAHVAKVYFF